MSIDSLFTEIRARCPERAWSQGVRFARGGHVVGVSDEGDEIVLTVRSPSRPVPLKVWLWPEDGDWACDCEGSACAHAAAAIISLKQSRAAGQGLPKPAGLRTLRYALRRGPRGLAVRREIVEPDGRAVPLTGPVRRQAGLQLQEGDLEADAVLDVATERIPAAGWIRLLRAWARASARLTLDGQPVQASDTPVRPVAAVRDDGPGFKVSLHRAKEVDEVFEGGVARVGDTLRPNTDGGLEPHQRQALIRGLRFSPDEVPRLVAELLPRLRERVEVKVKTERLPEGRAMKPALRLETRPSAGGLAVRLDLVYGDPPVARIEDDRVRTLGGVVPLRDLEAERALRDEAERLRLPIARDWTLSETDAIAFVRDRLPRFQGQRAGSAARFRVRNEPVFIGLSEDGTRLESEVSAAALLRAFAEGRSLVALEGGGYAPIPLALLERHGHLIGDLAAAADRDGRLPRHALPAAAALAEALDQPPPADLDRLRPLIEGFDGLPEVPLPPNLTATLRPYQALGVRWIRFLWSLGLAGILADDMGLGKTLQALCAIAGLKGRCLVIAPTSVLGSWAAEARRFLPGLSVCVYHGQRRVMDPDARLVISSYALLRLDEALSAERWAAVVLDEAQAIKNPESQTAQAAFQLDTERRLSMTGTPVENRLDELWSQLHFLMPGFLGGRTSFRDRYGKPIALGDAGAAQALQRRVRPFVLRRRKQDVARDLPPRTDLVLPCTLPDRQREVYEAVRLAAREEVAAMVGAGRTLQVLELLLRLRQAACHPGLLPGRDPSEPSGKLDELLQRLDEIAAEGHRALVFSQWTSFLDLIQAGLDDAGLSWCRLDGSTRDRQAVVDRFQADDGPPVFLISLRAGGTGLTLTAADYVFHTDPWWNPAVEQQATDRAHRIGQDKPVFSVRLIAEDTVEERILALQESKRALAEAALGDAAFLQGLSREDLLGLFA
ncbi:MAG: DEAD/DEAH box helicase [Alphaproteobacteria bacterium]|nr:DEAD/DEAH box helicase [Alphaproteobacteria bacterium]